MKSYLKLFVLLAVVTASTAIVSACADKTPPPAAPAPAPESVKPNS